MRARRGVIVGSGGFEHNAAMRAQYQRQPIGTSWTVGAKENTGDGIQAGHRAGAALDLMEDSWWGPAIPLPGRAVLLPGRADPARQPHRQPGRAAVRQRGRAVQRRRARHVRQEPGRAGHPGLADHRPELPQPLPVPRHAAAAAASRTPGTSRARWSTPGPSRTLAGKIGVPPAALRATVDRFNGFAFSGVDADFDRGAQRATTTTTPTRGAPQLLPGAAVGGRRSTPSRSCPATSAPRAACSPTPAPGCCAPTAR